jgi:hypothetical protein
MADLQVPVYILSAESRAMRAQNIRRVFSNPMFNTRIITVQTPEDLKSDLSRDDAIESYRFRKILEYSKEHDESDIVIVKDTSKPRATPTDIADAVRAITDNGENRADITYLSSWKEMSASSGRKLANNAHVVKMSTPNTLHAVVVTPHGRDLLLGATPLVSGEQFDLSSRSLTDSLNDAIGNGHITADIIVPSLFNTSKQPRKRAIIPVDREIAESRAIWMSPLAIIFIVLLVLLIVWAIYYYAYRKK